MKPRTQDSAAVSRAFRSKTHARLFRAAVKAGCTWRMAGSGHVHVRMRYSDEFVTLSTSAYDGKDGVHHIVSCLKRDGVQC